MESSLVLNSDNLSKLYAKIMQVIKCEILGSEKVG